MLHTIFALALFLLLLIIAVVFIALIAIPLNVLTQKKKANKEQDVHIKIDNLSEKYSRSKESLELACMPHKQQKKIKKNRKKAEKAGKKDSTDRSRIFSIHFTGDEEAKHTDHLSKKINAIISIAKKNDRVVLHLNSGGGYVHAYGLLTAEILRIKEAALHLTILVDYVAASGGYMAACVADRLICAPYAIIGSIGVVVGIPNMHRLMKKKDIDYFLFTAGKYKRTVTTLGEVDQAGKKKMQEDLEDTHQLFKDHVASYRSALNIEDIATGEYWYGKEAHKRQLVDAIQTSQSYMQQYLQDKQYTVYQLSIDTAKTGWLQWLQQSYRQLRASGKLLDMPLQQFK